MKVRGSLRKLCASCKIVRRGKKTYVICAETPRHKQRQGVATLAAAAGGAAPAPFARDPTFLDLCGGACAAHAHGEGAVAAAAAVAVAAAPRAAALPELR